MNASQPRHDDRRDPRHVTVMIVGKVSGPHGEYACLVKDVSRRGLQARFPFSPRVGERLVFALRDAPDQPGTVRWVDGLRGGVEFDQPFDPAEILAKSDPSKVARSPRFACRRLARLVINGQDRAIDLLDLSLGGAKLGLFSPRPEDLAGRGGTLMLPALGLARAGTVRWDNGTTIGFQFAAPLTIDALAGLLAHLSAYQP